MTSTKSLLRTLASWSLLILAIINLVQYARSINSELAWFFNSNNGIDDVTRWENRLEKLKNAIPSQVRTLGYISNDPQNIEFVLTQYTIIPRVLRRGIDPAWNIANYPGKAIHQALQKHGLTNYDLENFGFGLYLVHTK